MTTLLQQNSSVSTNQNRNRITNKDGSFEGELWQNIIKLQLKKPETWNWELTTSKSSENIAYPRILLYDDKGNMLADARTSGIVFNSAQLNKSPKEQNSDENVKSKPSFPVKCSRRRSSIANLYEANVGSGDFTTKDLNSKRECLKYSRNLSSTSIPSDLVSHTSYIIETPPETDSGTELDNLKDNESETFMGVNNKSRFVKKNDAAKIFNEQILNKENHLNLAETNFMGRKNSSTEDLNADRLTVRFNLKKCRSTANAFEREKLETPRSSYSDPCKSSRSVWAKINNFKRRSSSTDSQELQGCQYNCNHSHFLRTSNAGTILVCEDSFRNRKVRRRKKATPRILETDENGVQDHNEAKFLVKSQTGPENMHKLENLISQISLYQDQKTKNSRSCSNLYAKTRKIADCGTLSSSFPIIEEPEAVHCGKRIPGDLKIKQRRRQLRKCASSGTMCPSTDDEGNVLDNRSFKNRARRKTAQHAINDIKSLNSQNLYFK